MGDRIGGTLASVICYPGVQIFRVHLREVKQGILVFKKILLNK